MTRQLRQVLHTLGTRAVLFVVSGVIGIMLNRMLHPEGRGQYYVIVTIATTAMALGHLSIEQSHVRLWTSPRNRQAIAANSVFLGVLLGLLAALVAILAVIGLGEGVVPVTSYGLLILALAAVPGAMTVLYLNNVLVLRSRVDVVNRSAMWSALLIWTALVFLGWTGRLSVAWAILLWAVSMVIPLVVVLPAVGPSARFRDLTLASRALGIGARYHTGLAALYLLFRIDVLIINAFTSAAAVGLYSLAVSLIELARTITDAIAQVALPHQIESEHAEAADLTARITRLSALLSLGAVGLICAAGWMAIPIVYGPAFAGCVPALLALAPGLWALGVTRTVGVFLLRLDRPMLMSAISIVSLLINVGLNFALIPLFGITGSAVAASVAYAALAAMQSAWFLRASGLPVRRLVPGRADVRSVARAFPRLGGRAVCG